MSVLAQKAVWVGVGSCSSEQPFYLSSQHISWDSSWHPISGVETTWKKSDLTWERFHLTKYSDRWVEPINLISCLIFSFCHSKCYYYISLFKRKTPSLLWPLSKGGDSGVRDLDKACRPQREFLPEPF